MALTKDKAKLQISCNKCRDEVRYIWDGKDVNEAVQELMKDAETIYGNDNYISLVIERLMKKHFPESFSSKEDGEKE